MRHKDTSLGLDLDRKYVVVTACLEFSNRLSCKKGMCKLIIVERLDVISARNWAVT